MINHKNFKGSARLNRNYRRTKNFIEKKNRNELRKIKRQNRQQKIFESVIAVVSFWTTKKMMTLISFFWFSSLFAYNFGTTFSRDNLQKSEKEIHRLNRNLEKLPELQFQIQNQENQLKQISKELLDQKTLGDKSRIQSLTLTNELKESAETINQCKQEYEQKLQAYKNLNQEKLDSIQKTYKLNQKKLQEELNENKLQRFELENLLDKTIEDLNNSQQQFKDAKFELENFKISAKNDSALIRQLKQKIMENEQQFLLYSDDLLKIRAELKELTDKLKSIENRSYLNSVLYGLEHILRNKVFHR
jgi:hypothetical protein